VRKKERENGLKPHHLRMNVPEQLVVRKEAVGLGHREQRSPPLTGACSHDTKFQSRHFGYSGCHCFLPIIHQTLNVLIFSGHQRNVRILRLLWESLYSDLANLIFLEHSYGS
jgi:hypothetical protein